MVDYIITAAGIVLWTLLIWELAYGAGERNGRKVARADRQAGYKDAYAAAVAWYRDSNRDLGRTVYKLQNKLRKQGEAIAAQHRELKALKDAARAHEGEMI